MSEKRALHYTQSGRWEASEKHRYIKTESETDKTAGRQGGRQAEQRHAGSHSNKQIDVFQSVFFSLYRFFSFAFSFLLTFPPFISVPAQLSMAWFGFTMLRQTVIHNDTGQTPIYSCNQMYPGHSYTIHP